MNSKEITLDEIAERVTKLINEIEAGETLLNPVAHQLDWMISKIAKLELTIEKIKNDKGRAI